MRHVKSNLNILQSPQNKIQSNPQSNLKPSQSNNNIKNPHKNLKISEQEMKLLNNQNNFLLNLCEKTSKSSFSSLIFNNNNNYKTIINSFSPNKINSFNKNNKSNTKTIFNTNTNSNYIENNTNNNTNRGISIRLNFKNKIINNNFARKNRVKKSIKKPAHNTPKNINVNSNYKSDFNVNEKIKEKDKQITILQKDLLQSQKLLNQLQEEKQNEISSTYNSIKRVDSFINNNFSNNSYLNNNNSINTNYNRMKKYSSLSNFFVSKTDKNLNILRTFYGKSKLISNKSNSKRSIYNSNYTINYNNSKSKNRIKRIGHKKNNLNIFTNPLTFAKFQIFNNNTQNKNKICKTRNNIHKNYNNFHNFNSGSNSNIKKKNKNFIRALSCSPNKILAQFLNQYESINCKTAKNTFRKNLSIKSTSPSSAQNRFNNKRIRNLINKDKNRRNKDLDYIIKKGEDLKNRMKNLLYNYISLSSEIKKRYIKTEFK